MDATPEIVFLCPPIGGQHINMGKELFETNAFFKEALLECNSVAAPLLPQPLVEVLYPSAKAATMSADVIHTAAFAQPCLFAVEYALGKTVIANGYAPTAVVGHSVGEFVAAVFAGIMDMPTALTLVCERSTQMHNRVQIIGGMLAVRASCDECEAAVAAAIAKDATIGERVAIAAFNGPKSTVLAGENAAISAVLEVLPEDLKMTRVRASHADHSPVMKPICEPLRNTATKLFATHSPQPPSGVTMASTVTGHLVGTAELLGAEHWVQHTMGAVRFSAALASLLEVKTGMLFVELGEGMLTRFVSECVDRKVGGEGDAIRGCAPLLPQHVCLMPKGDVYL